MTENARTTGNLSGTYDLTVSRVLPATPDEVFDAYTDPEKQKVWFTILDPGTIIEVDVDLRVGGTWTAVWGPDRDNLFRETQTFLEIDRPRRLVTESVGSDPSGDSITTRIEITFTAQDGGTLMTIYQVGFPAAEMRDFIANEAYPGFFDRIEAFLTS